nr:polymorphic toxin type 37 domain-containing protein [Leptospira wolffii]
MRKHPGRTILSAVPGGDQALQTYDTVTRVANADSPLEESFRVAGEGSYDALSAYLTGKTVQGAVGLAGQAKGLLKSSGKGHGLDYNPFKGKKPAEIEKIFEKKGFEKRGPDPVNGKGGYVNPKTNRSYHIDPGSLTKYKKGPEYPHVDVNRKSGKLAKRKYPIGEKLNEKK